MTKQEKIQDIYEKLGFEWNVCSKYITENGVLILPTPDLKYSLKGYENLVKDENKFSAFGKEGLKLQPTELSGIYNNNGWNSIEEKGLPECEKTVIWLRDEGEPPVISSMLDEDFYGVDYFTHWMEIASKAPIY